MLNDLTFLFVKSYKLKHAEVILRRFLRLVRARRTIYVIQTTTCQNDDYNTHPFALRPPLRVHSPLLDAT